MLYSAIISEIIKLLIHLKSSGENLLKTRVIPFGVTMFKQYLPVVGVKNISRPLKFMKGMETSEKANLKNLRYIMSFLL